MWYNIVEDEDGNRLVTVVEEGEMYVSVEYGFLRVGLYANELSDAFVRFDKIKEAIGW